MTPAEVALEAMQDIARFELEIVIATEAIAQLLALISYQGELAAKQGQTKAEQDVAIWALQAENELLRAEMQRYTRNACA